MALSYLFDPNKQFQDKNGVNNVGGYLYVFINDSDDHAPTYCNFTGTLNPERIVLDNNGRAVVIVDELKTYRIEVYDRSGNMLWSQYPVRPTNVIYGDYNVYNADIYGTPDEIDVDVEMYASGVKKFTIKLANAVKTVIVNIQDTISSIVETVSTKADKVQGAPAGNLAALDATGNLTNSGKKVTDFKTKQTAVEDPAPDGFGLSFINSVSQNANGEITPNKKTVQDGSTTQKGVVQLQDSIGSTESVTDRAVTPHAVRAAIDAAVSSAYHAAGTKTVAQLTGSLLIAENEGCVYNVTDSGTTTADFVDGAGHPINAGDNVGVCDVGGGVYKFDLLSGFVDLSNYLTNTGDASNATSTFTKAIGDTSSMTSGGKLSELFTAISNFFASLKALAFKDTAGTSDIADDAITAAKVKDNETLPVNISGNASSATNLAPGGTSGQYLKSNGFDTAPSWDNVSNLVSGETRQLFGVQKAIGNGMYHALLKVNVLGNTNYAYSGAIFSFTARTANKEDVRGIITVSAFEFNEPSTIVCRTLLLDSRVITPDSSIPQFYIRQTTADNKWAYELWVRVTTNDCVISVNAVNDSRNSLEIMSEGSSAPPARLTECDLYSNVRAKCTSNTVNGSKVGSPSQPVYVASDGSVNACLTGIRSYYFSSTNYYKLADITFGEANLTYAGVQIAAQLRDNNNITASVIIAISFSEYSGGDYNLGIIGRVFVTLCRGDASVFSSPGFIFFVKKNTDTSYTLYIKVANYRSISFALISGSCTGFSVPATPTTISYSSSDTKLSYFVPSGTTYTPTGN